MKPLAVARLVRERRATRSRFTQLFALSVILMTVLSLNYELVHGPARYLDEVRATAWVTMPANDNLIANSYFTESTLNKLQRSPGIASADGVFLNYTAIRGPRASISGIALSYNPTGITAPRLSAGHQANRPGETVLDTLLPSRLGVKLGGVIHIGTLELTVVGLAPGVNSIAKDVAFLRPSDMAKLTGSYVYGAAAVAGNLASIRTAAAKLGLRVFTKQAWVSSNVAYWNAAIGPLFSLVVFAVAIFGVLLVASSLRREIETNRRISGVLFAIGYPRIGVVASEYTQVVVVGVLAFVVALPVAAVLVALSNNAVIGISAVLDSYAIRETAGIMAAVCVLAPIGPLIRLSRTDAAIVYRE